MKRLSALLVSALLIVPFTGAAAQSIQNATYQTVGYIKSDGTIQDRTYKTIGYIKDDGTVQDRTYRTIGYL